MRIVFFGTPAFAVPSLEALLERGHPVVAAVTQPDRPRGRSRSTLVAPPVKVRAQTAGVPVSQPERPRGDPFAGWLRDLTPDLGVVVAYGHILRPEILAIPRHGMINVHASLLPRHRGAAPIQWAIAAGDRETGVTIMRMDAGMDSGPMLGREATPIGPDETGGDLTERLARLGAGALVDVLDRFDDAAEATPQDPSLATLAPKIGRETARIDWTRSGDEVARRIRAFDPVPGAWTSLGGLELKCFRPRVVAGAGTPGGPITVGGTLVAADGALVVAAGTGAVRIGEVQPAGRTRMPADEWLRGHPLPAEARLG